MGEGIAFSLSQIKRMCFDIYGGDSMSKHMNLSDRTTIEQRLCAGVSIRQIAKELGKAPSTISREIQGHRIVSNKSGYGRIANRCIHRMDCCASNLCTECKHEGSRFCRTCNLCNSVCADFEEEHCGKLTAPPYVCNGCPDRQRCTMCKFVYESGYAQKEYREVLVGRLTKN